MSMTDDLVGLIADNLHRMPHPEKGPVVLVQMQGNRPKTVETRQHVAESILHTIETAGYRIVYADWHPDLPDETKRIAEENTDLRGQLAVMEEKYQAQLTTNRVLSATFQRRIKQMQGKR